VEGEIIGVNDSALSGDICSKSGIDQKKIECSLRASEILSNQVLLIYENEFISTETSTIISGDIQSASRTICSIDFSLVIKTDTLNYYLFVTGLCISILNGLSSSVRLDSGSKVDRPYRRSIGRLNIS
jgi:hypothetical protein